MSVLPEFASNCLASHSQIWSPNEQKRGSIDNGSPTLPLRYIHSNCQVTNWVALIVIIINNSTSRERDRKADREGGKGSGRTEKPSVAVAVGKVSGYGNVKCDFK